MAVLTMADVEKNYGGVRALVGASLEVERGEVHGLLGPNGSGKSTLNKVLAGTVSPDSASITIEGERVAIRGPRDAYGHGVAAVYQQLSLIPELSVADNLVLGLEPGRFGFLRRSDGEARAREAFALIAPGMGDGVGIHTRVGALGPGQQQLVEIAKAILREPRILVLDEATASLRSDQVGLLFTLVRSLTESGTSVVFVSHRLDEVMSLCTRATILRNGSTVATVDIASTNERELVRLMVGEAATQDIDAEDQDVTMPPPTEEIEGEPSVDPPAGRPSLQVEGLTSARLRGVDLEVRPGEVLGLGGLQGQGQSELLLALFGAARHEGTIRLAGTPVTNSSPRRAIANRFAFVPGDRGTDGLFMIRPIQENLSVVSLGRRLVAKVFISMRAERAAARTVVDQLRIKIGSLADPVTTLSGGNAQKVAIAKWLLNGPRVALLDDPTKGVDVGAKEEIYAIIRGLVADGVAVILNSSDDRELTDLCDRVLVMYEGRIVEELAGERITHDNLVASALRVTPADEGEATP